MPFIGASASSTGGFQSLMERLSRSSTPVEETTDPLLKNETSNKLEGGRTQSQAKTDLPNTGDQKCSSPEIRNSSVMSTASSQGSMLSSTMSEDSIQELLRFPNSSTHAYSYNPFSPYSLSVRLSVLKRSLEIMINNPSLLNESMDINPVQQSQVTLTAKLPQSQKVLRNASSAALSAFFNTSNSASQEPQASKTLKSTSSSPGHNYAQQQQQQQQQLLALTSGALNKIGTRNSLPTTWEIGGRDSEETSPTSSRRSSVASAFDGLTLRPSVRPSLSYQNSRVSIASDYIEEKRADLESLLKLLNKALEQNEDNAAISDLHMMSLLNINKISLGGREDKKSQDASSSRREPYDLTIKKNLLDSLAQPFHEAYNTREALLNEKDLESKVEEYSRNPNSLTTGNRILHTFTSQKNSSPKAIFTCSQQHPWNFKAANDSACLIFGISSNVMRALTLLDLIHNDSRNFVLNKILTTEDQEQVFTGEIIAIKQPGHSSAGIIWSSIWAKRKNGLIVCVFEKVPCDYMDVLLNLGDFTIEKVIGGEGLHYSKEHIKANVTASTDGSTPKKSVKFGAETSCVSGISTSLSQLISDVISGKIVGPDEDLLSMPVRVSNNINRVRYFTLNYLEYNIPCAVSSSILENDLKMKIHSLPYQAGVFIINSHTFELISFNKSISKNMFGLHSIDLIGKSVAEVIPEFPQIISYVKEHYPEWDITLAANKGLVLTEHFFRKVYSQMRNDGEDFYHSIGIDAVHRDGCVIKVDFQLRVISLNTIVLWITHSRDIFLKDYRTNPSQLNILNEDNINSVSSGTTSGNSSTAPSQKTSVTDVKTLQGDLRKRTLSLEGTTVGSNMEETTTTSKTNNGSKKEEEEDTLSSLDDLELRAKLEIAKRFSQDKSEFVKDNNFKLDKDLIVNITSSSLVGDDCEGYDTHDKDMSKIFQKVTIPHEIGAMKHTKKFSDFVILQKMGEGAYGKVDLCMHKVEKYIVVIKRIYKERILVDTWVRDRNLGTVPSEIQIMVTLNKSPHDNILKILDFFEDDDYYYIETEIHGESGSIDLFDLIELKTNMTEFEAKLLFKQVVSGIKHLHDHGIVHRDIKDENVIVDNKGFVKLIDFGSAAYVKNGPFDVFVGTIDYAAPEVLGGEPYEGKPQDIWAIGVLLYTIIYKENPFYNIDEILDGDLRIQLSNEVSPECVTLIRKILNRSVAKRPTIDEIVEDGWLKL